MARHQTHRDRVLEDHALQVSDIIMMEKTPSITKFNPNLKAGVFALMQTALPIEAEVFGLPKDAKAGK